MLTANNLRQGQGLVCCSVSMWLTRMVGTLQLSAEGPRRYTEQGPLGTNCQLYPKRRAVPNSLASSRPRPGRGRGEMPCWMSESTQTVEMENTRNQHSANSRCRALSQAATTPWAASGEALGILHFHFKTATESTADPKNGTLQQPLHLQATHLNQQDLPAEPHARPHHTHPSPSAQVRPGRTQGLGSWLP